MTESRILSEIEACCSHYKICVLPRNPKKLSISVWAMPDPVFHVGVIWRQNAGGAKYESRFVRFGLPGTPDFSGWLFKTGQRIGIEAKTSKGKSSLDQIAHWGLAHLTNSLVGIARSYDSCAILLESWGLRRPA